MLSKRSKLTGSVVSGKWAGLMDAATSPRSPLEIKIQSPRGLKKYDVGGVGLGIVAALDKAGEGRGEVQAEKALYNRRNMNRSNPIPVKNSGRCGGGFEEMNIDNLEEYTLVTCHGPNKSYTTTRVYYGTDGGKIGLDRIGCDRRNAKGLAVSVFDISPANFGDVTAYPTSDFLSSCHLCRKKLYGKDIYMYRGEKAFCSTECRYRQIVMDEHKEQCSSEASRSADVSNSPYSSGQIFYTGILAI